MRPALLAAAALVAAIALLFVADSLLGDRLEGEAERALSDDLAQRTGTEPTSVEVSLTGTLAALRALSGPAPDATAVARGVAIPGTSGRLTRLVIDLSDVDAGTRGAMPFRAGSGRFTAVLSEEDLNGAIGDTGVFERLVLEPDAIVAITSGGDPTGEAADGDPQAAEGLTFMAELGRDGDADVLMLRAAPAEDPADALGLSLAGSVLTIPFALPPALKLDSLDTREGRLVGSGAVDVDQLAAGG